MTGKLGDMALFFRPSVPISLGDRRFIVNKMKQAKLKPWGFGSETGFIRFLPGRRLELLILAAALAVESLIDGDPGKPRKNLAFLVSISFTA
jgi:hypothetical protein